MSRLALAVALVLFPKLFTATAGPSESIPISRMMEDYDRVGGASALFGFVVFDAATASVDIDDRRRRQRRRRHLRERRKRRFEEGRRRRAKLRDDQRRRRKKRARRRRRARQAEKPLDAHARLRTYGLDSSVRLTWSLTV